ncbi:acyl-CoA dehydrogenase family protein [Aromatoleum petrolei]|uniref:Pimeloyl-CoA dehydrogenase small subunit n=1 Tax=Aromatoleum petrolei TaxID=76116 RepID=A0ABX1MR84_9RHOO|nr:acyl-CoA dehydrogenase family protein [Aromatoleum petrolei]NMF88619.1 pimeloyl-CoA dehydrogenase small subunit [Aromatoleum petrolei]QTQ34673.1 Putative acyl-CoA dehydrogenase/oxidase [Aromatoleum petrolei]
MNFDLSDEQRMLKDSVDRLIAEQYDFESRKTYAAQPDGWSRKRWAQFAEMGLLALPFSEEDGGFGGGPVETMLVMEAFGRGLVLEPYLSTVVVCGNLLRLGASAAQRADLIPSISDGGLLMAFAHGETQSRFDLADVATTARKEGDGWLLNGAKRHVLHGDSADWLIVSARVSGDRRDRDGIALFLVDAKAVGVARRSYTVQNGWRAADVDLCNVRVPSTALIGTTAEALPLIERVVDIALTAICTEAVGAMEKATEITVEYLKVRKQFGVTIGSFQALQHRAVDMLVAVEQARSMAMFATMMADEKDAVERSRSISAAKVQIGKSARFVGTQAIQLHGGIGVTEECNVGHYYRHLTVLEILFGDTHHHLSALALAGGLPSAA